jgi:hypothetical protein
MRPFTESCAINYSIASYNNDVTMVETGSPFSLAAPLSSVSIQPAFASPFHVALSAG